MFLVVQIRSVFLKVLNRIGIYTAPFGRPQGDQLLLVLFDILIKSLIHFFLLQLTLNYQIKLKNLTEVLKRDHDFLKKMTQPNQVKEQLAQLYRELEETGEAIRPLLEADLTNSCTSSSSNYSTGEECEEFYINTQKQRQVGTAKCAA